MIFNPIFDNKMARWLEEQGYNFPPKMIVSFSGGKDSTAMLHRMLEWGFPIDALLFFDTGWEFPEMYHHLALVMQKTGLDITVLHPRKPFAELIKKYRWPDSRRRWCTAEKRDAATKWINQNYNKKEDYIVHCMGFALDELHRTDTKEMLKKGLVMYPLLNDFCMDPVVAKYMIRMQDKSDDFTDGLNPLTEGDALQYCFDLGYTWDGLYERFNRVSCFCCPLKRKKDLRVLREYYPDLWARSLKMEQAIPESKNYITFKGKESLTQIDDRLSTVAINLGHVTETEQVELFPLLKSA